MRELRRITLLALVAVLTVTGGVASAAKYTGPRYGVPFDVRLSGTQTRTWTISGKSYPCEPAGGGTQTVSFHTPGVAHARFAATESHSPTARFFQVRIDLPLAFTIDREDDTQLVQPTDGESCDPTPPTTCGERTLQRKGFGLIAENRRLSLQVHPDVDGRLDDAVDKLYAQGTYCLAPEVESVIAGKVRWPGNAKAFRPGRHLHFTVTKTQTHKSWVERTSKHTDLFDTSEQVQSTFTVDLRNRCRPVPKRYRKATGFVCDAENGTIPVR